MEHSGIQLTKEGVRHQINLARMAEEFSREHSLRLRGLLHPDLVQMTASQIARGVWLPYTHDQRRRELLLQSPGTLSLLRFLVNTPEFLSLVRTITRIDAISVFDGRNYRMEPDTDHYDSWHTDEKYNRLIGMSLNLGTSPYSGGVFQMRKKGSEEIFCELPNVNQGDAILFRISPELEHRITPMEGTEPKIAFAGWFRSGVQDLFSQIRDLRPFPAT